MQQIIILLTTFTFLFGAVAQEQPNLIAPNKITTIAYWSKGEKKTYTKTTTTQRFKGESQTPAQEETVTETFELKVVDSAEHYYIMEARYGGASSSKSNPELDDLTKDLKLNSAIRYRIDEFGSFDTILNLPQLKKELQQSFDQLKANYKAKHTADESNVFFKLIDNMKKMYDDLSNVEDLFVADILYIHGYYGTELVVGKPEEFELVYPMIGDVYIGGTGTMTLSAISKATDIATINATSRPNKDELTAAMSDIMKSFLTGTQAETEKMDANVSSTGKEKIQIRLSDGWIEKLEMSQVINITVSGKKAKVVKKIAYTL